VASRARDSHRLKLSRSSRIEHKCVSAMLSRNLVARAGTARGGSRSARSGIPVGKSPADRCRSRGRRGLGRSGRRGRRRIERWCGRSRRHSRRRRHTLPRQVTASRLSTWNPDAVPRTREASRMTRWRQRLTVDCTSMLRDPHRSTAEGRDVSSKLRCRQMAHRRYAHASSSVRSLRLDAEVANQTSCIDVDIDGQLGPRRRARGRRQSVDRIAGRRGDRRKGERRAWHDLL
jgi:hypothetical protein